MNPAIDLKSYFKRVRYVGTPTYSLDTLRRLHWHHTQAISIENLNPFLGIPVKLDLESLQQKMIHDERGGYCFEQNILFRNVLESIGFSVTGLAARVLWNQPEELITRRSHMLLMVQYKEEKYIADVGFGAMTLTSPILLETGKVQQTAHEPFRLIRQEDGYYFLQAEVRNEWKTLYRFNLEEQFLVDYEMANWYISTHPQSGFVTGLVAARPGKDCRYTLNNNLFKVHLLDGKTKSRTIATVPDLRNVLENKFLLEFPDVPGMDELFQQKIFSK